MLSRMLNERQLRGLARAGDILLPGEGGLARFSDLDCLDGVDQVLAPSHPDDLRDLRILLSVLSVMPEPLLRGLFRLLETAHAWPDRLGAPLRLLDIGLRGLLFTLYYGAAPGMRARAPAPWACMGYAVHCEPDHVAPAADRILPTPATNVQENSP
ncbi:MAG: hypothetical protein LPK85_02290 [Gammaproteobacteria bacterium]|nr:hypothetical protein [Gammaproteobacteria bacterium]